MLSLTTVKYYTYKLLSLFTVKLPNTICKHCKRSCLRASIDWNDIQTGSTCLKGLDVERLGRLNVMSILTFLSQLQSTVQMIERS